MTEPPAIDLDAAKRAFTAKARALGFDSLGVAAIDIAEDEGHLIRWLEAGLHGDMEYMRRNLPLRARPQQLLPGTVRVVSVRMDYWPGEARAAQEVLDDRTLGYVSRYALGRDYHKVLRRALANLATGLARQLGPFGYRVCVDSAPVLEKAHARNAGLGWIGKHTNLIARDAGSWFFLGEMLTDLPLPQDAPASRPLRHVCGVHSGLPYAGDRRPLAARCAPLHFLSHHRAPGRHPRRVAPGARQPHLRLR